MEYFHARIKKGNIMYAYHAGNIYKDKSLTVKNGSGQAIKKEKSLRILIISFLDFYSLR
jgi:hypothetical protein